MLIIRGSNPHFLNGDHEEKTVFTVPLAKRSTFTADPGQILVFIGFITRMIASVPHQYLVPVIPGPGDLAVVIRPELLGLVVRLQKEVSFGNLLVGDALFCRGQFKFSALELVKIRE